MRTAFYLYVENVEEIHKRAVEQGARAFMNMDERLMKYLRDKAKINQNEMLNVTHQQISEDLHTSRMVISRILKKN